MTTSRFHIRAQWPTFAELAPWLGGVVLILLSLVVAKQAVRRYAIERERRSIEQRISELQAQSADLAKVLSYAETKTFTEEQARLRLGVAKSGEQLAIISPPQIGTVTSSLTQAKSSDAPSSSAQNSLKWWQYFFSP